MSPVDWLFGLDARTLAVFFRQLATMVNAGMTCLAAVVALEPTFKGRVGAFLKAIIPAMIDGATLSSVLARYPAYFSPFIVAMIRAGEESGTLDVRLNDLANFLEDSRKAQLKLISKFIYPALVLHAAMIIPPLVLLFTEGIMAYIYTVVSGILTLWSTIFLVWVLLRIRRTVLPIAQFTDYLVSYIPLVGGMARGRALVWFLRSLASLYDAGVTVEQCLVQAARASGNVVVYDAIIAAMKRGKEGDSLGEILGRSQMLSAPLLQMIKVGEESGQVPTMARKSADFLEPEIEAATHTIMIIIPILLFLCVAGMVAMTAISTISNIYRGVL